MGVVYLGEHNLIGRRAAIKVLHRDRGAQRENVERFFNEARATSTVEDPGIVHIYDFGITADDTAYLVMEYLDGESLSMRLRRCGALPPHDALRITRQIASSLAAAHAVNIVHRDLKPENLFMVRDGEAAGGERPKILDFGIAKLGDSSADKFQTRAGAVMGTPAYMSPEQCNAGKIDQRTDVYSLGCVLFHLLVGTPPFDLEGVGSIISAHLREPAPVPSRASARVPAVIDSLIARCLAKNPDDRFATMLELQQACDVALAKLPAYPLGTLPEVVISTPRAEAVTTLGHSVGQTAGEPPAKRHGATFVIAAVAIAAGIGLAAATRPRQIVSAAAPAPLATPQPTITPIPAPPPVAKPVQPSPVEVKKPAPSVKKPSPKPDVDPYEDRGN
jgi:serine/threonine protein kinase